MSDGVHRAGLLGAVLTAVAAGVAAGVAIENRAVGRVRSRPDPEAREPFGALHTAGRTVLADDGVPLHVEIDGDPDAELTIVFVHGFTLSMDCWHYQRRDLGGHDRAAGPPAGRLVFYDQRSHGSSGRAGAVVNPVTSACRTACGAGRKTGLARSPTAGRACCATRSAFSDANAARSTNESFVIQLESPSSVTRTIGCQRNGR